MAPSNGVNAGMGHGEVAGFKASNLFIRRDFDMPLETGCAALGDEVAHILKIEALEQA